MLDLNIVFAIEFFILSRENIECLHASSQLITTRPREETAQCFARD